MVTHTRGLKRGVPIMAEHIQYQQYQYGVLTLNLQISQISTVFIRIILANNRNTEIYT